MNIKITLIAMSLTYPVISGATEIPVMGDTKAQFHQLCGKDIDVELIKIDDKTMLMGLKNKQTNNLDLFISSEQSPGQIMISQFTPVKYDSLSKNYIPLDDQDLEIVWGSSEDDNKKITYNLTLGPKTYSCGARQQWPSEKADVLYGESS